MFKEINQFSAHTPSTQRTPQLRVFPSSPSSDPNGPHHSAEAQGHHTTNLPQSQLANDHRNLVFEVLRGKKTQGRGGVEIHPWDVFDGPFFQPQGGW